MPEQLDQRYSVVYIQKRNSILNITASSPVSAIFGDGSISGPSVAASMVELLTNEETWNTWKFKFPVVLTPKTNQNKDG